MLGESPAELRGKVNNGNDTTNRGPVPWKPPFIRTV
jgi:hypothetical protein